MSIINVRVDERLIHGQVANMWTASLNINRIMVIDNIIAESEIDKLTLKMAVPAGVRLSVLPVIAAAENILAGRYNSQRVLILLKNISTLVDLQHQHLPLTEVNIANLSQREGGLSVTKSVTLSEQDITLLRYLKQNGIHLVSQRVPADDKLDLYETLINIT